MIFIATEMVTSLKTTESWILPVLGWSIPLQTLTLATNMTACGRLVFPILMAAGFSACFAGWSLWCFGGIREGVQFLRGERIVVDRLAADPQTIQPGEAVTAEFNLRNLSGESVEIHGAQIECSCVEPIGFPVTLGPGEHRTVKLSMAVATDHQGGLVTQQAALLMNIDHPPVVLTVHAQVSHFQRTPSLE